MLTIEGLDKTYCSTRRCPACACPATKASGWSISEKETPELIEN
jgi:hypothetical protein